MVLSNFLAGGFMIKKVLIWLLQVSVVLTVVLFAVCPVSCKITDEGVQLLHGDYVPPMLEAYASNTEQSLLLSFTKSVKIVGAIVTPFTEASTAGDNDSAKKGVIAPALAAASGQEQGIAVTISYEDDGRTVIATAAEAFEVGKQYELYGEAEDKNGNTLTFCIPFVGFNARVPRMIISGIHPMYASDKFKCEVVELYALTAGNIAGIVVSSAVDGNSKSFTLPAAEVNAGDVVIVHVRAKGDGCINELSDDLSLSSGWYTSDTVRDIWASNESARLADKEDIVLLTNSFTNEILDAVMYAPSASESWSKENIASVAQEIAHAGFWESEHPSAAVLSDGLSAAKMLKRKGCNALLTAAQNGTLKTVIAQNSENWYVASIKNGAFLPVE